MMEGKRVVVVMPAYNASLTLARTHEEVLAHGFVDHVIVVDDASRDDTADRAKSLPQTTVHVHAVNRGYGANQKSCYALALEQGADVVVMVHPDYQYTPRLLPALVAPIVWEVHDCMLGSRILGGRARSGGMPLYKYVANRALTTLENTVMRTHLTDLHTGYRAYSRKFLLTVPFLRNSLDFAFDSEILLQAAQFGFRIKEVPARSLYFDDASSISFRPATVYGLKTVWLSGRLVLHRTHVLRSRKFEP